jgi:hypothetical protein
LGRITPDQAKLAFAVRPHCHKHLADLLDAMAPGTKRKIIGNAYQGWERNYRNGYAALQRMRRLGLVPKYTISKPPANRQCIARSKQKHRRCLQWALPGKTVCRHHGGFGGNKKLSKLSPEAKQAKYLARMQRWHDREARKKTGLLPLTTGFKPESPQPTSLEEQFRQQPKPRVKPIYEA